MEKPHNISIELVRGCNLACSFCAIHSLPKERKYMTESTLMSVLNGAVPWTPLRIELCGRGECTLHPDIISMTRLIHSVMVGSQINLITNGILFSREMAIEMFKAGLNCAIVDCYGNTFENFKKRLDGVAPIIVYGDNDFSPFNRRFANKKVIFLVRDIKKHEGELRTREIHNWAGNVPTFNQESFTPLHKVCVDPFRFITILYDGSFIPCCRDWGEEYVICNVNSTDLYDAWYNNAKLIALRKHLIKGRRDLSPCNKCDWHGGFRKGLINVNKEYL